MVLNLTVNEFFIGAAIDHGRLSITSENLKGCDDHGCQFCFGSAGVPKWINLTTRSTARTWCIIALRKHFKLFCIFRPATLYKGLEKFCPLRADIAAKGFDMVVVVNSTGDLFRSA